MASHAHGKYYGIESKKNRKGVVDLFTEVFENPLFLHRVGGKESH